MINNHPLQTVEYILLWAFILLLTLIAGWMAFDYYLHGARRRDNGSAFWHVSSFRPTEHLSRLSNPRCPWSRYQH